MTRVRQFDIDDPNIKREALSFAKYHARTVDETFYSRTVDYNMIVNDTAILVQVPFNTYERIANLDSSLNYNTKDMSLIEKLQTYMTNSSLYAIATQSVIVNEGNQRAVAAVTGVFYDYAKFVLKLLNSTNDAFVNGPRMTKPAHCYAETSSNDEQCDDSKILKCGYSNDTIDCLIVDNNGFIIVSEDLEFIGRHLKAYDPSILAKLVGAGVFVEVNITDHQAICMKSEDRQQTSGALTSLFEPFRLSSLIAVNLFNNIVLAITHSWTIISIIVGSFFPSTVDTYQAGSAKFQQQPLQPLLPTLALLPNRTYLRPCEKVMTLYDFKPSAVKPARPEYYRSRCGCESWFVYEHVPKTNLLMIIVDTTTQCRTDCPAASVDYDSVLDTKETIIGSDEEQVCSMLEREAQLYSKRSDSCFSHHEDEKEIKLCGAACKTAQVCTSLLISMLALSIWLLPNNDLRHLMR